MLVGMPDGAYTPTCTNVHLPGYKESFQTFETTCGVDKIAVVSSNDRYVNDAWAKAVGIVEVTKEAGLVVLVLALLLALARTKTIPLSC